MLNDEEKITRQCLPLTYKEALHWITASRSMLWNTWETRCRY